MRPSCISRSLIVRNETSAIRVINCLQKRLKKTVLLALLRKVLVIVTTETTANHCGLAGQASVIKKPDKFIQWRSHYPEF